MHIAHIGRQVLGLATNSLVQLFLFFFWIGLEEIPMVGISVSVLSVHEVSVFL